MGCDSISVLARTLSGVIVLPLLAACSAGRFDDIDEFMAQKDKSAAENFGFIEEAPSVPVYEPFAYAATTERSPFDRPLDVEDQVTRDKRAVVKPDLSRPRELLETFTFDSLQLVGSLRRGAIEWALIKDAEGGIHRITLGNFLGRDHGKVTQLGPNFVSVVEIVPDGTKDGWVERPRIIELSAE